MTVTQFKNKKNLLFVVGGLCGILLQACTYFEEKPTVDVSAAGVVAGQVTYAMVQQKVFAPSCVRCHGTKGDINLESYASSFSALGKIRESVFVTNKMPKNQTLTSEQLALLKAWLDEGGPEVASQPPRVAQVPMIPIADLSYANVNAKVFKPFCMDCHKNDVGVDLQTYANVKENASRIAMAVFGEKTMPKKKTLGVAESTLLSVWIKAGAPENAPGSANPILPTYESISKNIFEPLCMNCHGSGKIAKKKPLEPYSAMLDATIKDNDTVVPFHPDDSSILEVITKSETDKDRMPPIETHIGSLTPEMVDVIKTWINAGAPEK